MLWCGVMWCDVVRCTELCHAALRLPPLRAPFLQFLYDPFPVESSLHNALHEHLNAEIVAGTISKRQDAVDYLTWTYLFRRILQNPTYYGVENITHESITIFLSRLVEQVPSATGGRRGSSLGHAHSAPSIPPPPPSGSADARGSTDACLS